MAAAPGIASPLGIPHTTALRRAPYGAAVPWPMPNLPTTPPWPAATGAEPRAWRQVAVGVRARQWWYFLVLPAAGLPLAAWRSPSWATLAALVQGATVAAGCLAFAYGVNGLTERHTDMDPHKNPWIGQDPAKGAGLLLASIAAATAGLGAAGGRQPLLASLLSLFAGAVYSLGPRGKQRLIVGTVLNVLIFAPLLLVAPGAQASLRLAGWGSVFSALLLQNQLIHEQADASEDAAAGARSTATWLGAGRARAAFGALGLAAASAAWPLLPGLVATVLAATALLATGAALAPQPPRQRRAWQRSVALVGGAIAFAAEAFAGPLGLG